jgi:hypothetical protein
MKSLTKSISSTLLLSGSSKLINQFIPNNQIAIIESPMGLADYLETNAPLLSN